MDLTKEAKLAEEVRSLRLFFLLLVFASLITAFALFFVAFIPMPVSCVTAELFSSGVLQCV